MIELPVTLTSTGGAVSFASPVPLGYTKNKGVYRLLVTAEGEWEGLTIRCFWHLPGGTDPASSLVQDGAVDVPASVTAQPGNGCITFEGSDGVKTVTSADLRYRVGSNSGTEDGTMPEPGTPAWEQLVSETAVALEAVQNQIGNLDDLTTKAKETLVAAINEAARTGSGGAGSITMRTDGGYIQYSTDDGSTWENLIALDELKGEPGKNGADGYSPTASVEQSTDGAKITITDKSGTTEAVVKNGKDGANGRDGADGQPGRDGADGAPGRDGVDGQPGKDGKDGITPTIGANGNWYLGEEDTGKPSRGAKGDKGDPGAPGANKADYQARFDGKFLQIAYSYVDGGGATNSKEHYEHCAKNDYDAVKADLRLTSDNQLVCCHDAGITLNADGRIVSYDSSNSTAIHEMTKAQFMALEFNRMYDGVRCHTCDLETFLQICKNAGKIAYITIRGEYVDATVAALVAAVQDASMVSRTIINSFTMDALTAVRAAEPDLYLSLVIDPFTESERTTALAYAQGKKTCQICLYYNNGSHTLAEMAANSAITAWISSCIAAGIRLVGAQADAAADTNTLLKLGFCGVQTRVSRLTNASYDGLDISALNIAATSTDDATTLTFSDAKGNQKTAEIPKLQPTDAQVQAGVESWMDKNATPTEVWSKNVLNVNDTDVSMGYIASAGQINGSDTYWVSGYIPAKKGDVLRSSLNGSTANFYYVAEYNSAKGFLTRASKSANTYTVSNESAAYIRVSWKTSAVSYQNEKAMLTLNNPDLTFEEYGSHIEGGIIPTIGDNGNWYLGGTDTGKPSRGATGDTGPAGATGAQGPAGTDGKSAYQYAVDGGYTGTEDEFAAKLAQEIPSALPNPNALTFTGAVTGSYDGSAPLTVNIPEGGGGTGGGGGSGWSSEWKVLAATTLSEDVVNVYFDFDSPVQEILIKANIGGDGTNRAITLFGTSSVGYGKNIVTFDNVLRTDTAVSAWLAIYAQAFKNFAFVRCQYYLYNRSVGQNTPMFNASQLAFTDQTNNNFVGENFPCINIGCWKAGTPGVIKAGTRIEILGR